MKIVKFKCNCCHFDIKDRKGYGMMWSGKYGEEDLEIVGLNHSENHICFNCFSKIQNVKINEDLKP
jgi:hypothetical protein